MIYPRGITKAAFWAGPNAAPIVSDSLPSVNTNAFGVSDLGEVAGWGLDAGGSQVAFVWRPLTAPAGLLRLPTFGVQETQAYDIIKGWVVGTANDGVHGQVAVRWQIAGGAPMVLSPPGLGFVSRAYGISPNGQQIVGYDELNPGTFVFGAALWTPPGGESIYGPSSTEWPKELRDINDLGVEVGKADVNGVANPWVHLNGLYATTLSIPAGQSAEAFSINAACEIVGWGSGSAWLWVPSRCP
jgi:uncharacterized membrane protein